jgi:transmembrane sensor
MISTEERMRAAIATQATEWFVAHRAGELSEARREVFIDWLRASPAHAQEYLALTGFAEDLGQVAKRFTAPADVLVARARSEGDVVQPLFRASRVSAPRRGPWPLFAALAASFMMALAALWWTHNRADYSTAHAEQRSWRLEDGSTVHLNSGSRIKVKFDAKRRQVELIKGQAVFQVAKDVTRPFWVDAGDVAVKAVGTEFDVYRQPQGAVVSVMEGRVAVWNAPAESAAPVAQLDAGQQARVTGKAAVVSGKVEDVRKTVAWLQRQVVFDHDALEKAATEFNRYNELQIRVDDAALRNSEVSGIFSAYDAESFVRFLERQPRMSVEREGDEVLVRAAQ